MKRYVPGVSSVLVGLAFLVLPAFALADVSNGSFENGTSPNSFLTLTAPNTTDITNWSVDSGTVDYIGTYWTAAAGARSIDLDGSSQGSISQTFSTVIGTTYHVTFDLSGNPDGTPSLKDVQVSATGGSPQDFTYDTSAKDNTDANMMWQPETYTFTATAASTVLSFASQTAGSYGPALDNVVVTPVTPTCTATPSDGTAAVIATASQTITGTIDATGCDIGVYIGTGISNVTVNATIHDANQAGVLADGATTATVSNSTVYNIGTHTGATFTPNGAQSGNGIRFQGSSTGSITGNTVYAYEKNGIAVTHGSTANITNNIVTGLGSVNFIAANGIEVFDGSSGSVTGNTVTKNYCTVSSVGDNCTLDPTNSSTAVDGATGILVYGPTSASVTVSNNTLTGNQYGIWSVATPAVSITGNTVTGTGGTTDTGITVWSADEYTASYPPLTETSTTGSITNNVISGDKYAVLLKKFSEGTFNPQVVVNRNSLIGTTDGLWTNTTSTIDGTCNWWDNASGPGPVGPGSGSNVTANVTYTPWLASSNLSGTCTGGVPASVTTDAATAITTTGATVNATNGPSAGTDTSFWFGTPAGGPFTPSATPATELPSGWSGVDSLTQLANATFGYSLTGLTPGTTYNFVAWTLVSGIWYPGAVLQFTTASVTECNNNASQTIVSDTSTQDTTDAHAAVAVTPNGAWTSISGATWVYSAALDGNGSSPTGTKTFTRTFTIVGTPADSSLQIAADNMYTVTVNGNLLSTGSSATTLNNYSSPSTWTIPAADLLSGSNTITFTVTNPAVDPITLVPFGDPNPAGLLYSLTVNNNECVVPASVTTDPATLVTSTSATVNGTNGPSAGTDTSFWLGTTPAGPFTPSPTPVPPAGWSGVDSGAQLAGAAFSHAYTGLTPGTTYYFAAWTLVSGTWYPGAVLSFIVTNTGTPKLGSISGIKFEDWDADSSPYEKQWEVKLGGWTIYLDTNNNGVLDSGEPSTVTNNQGAYSFKNLPAGTYHVREVQKPGWIGITPATGVNDVVLTAGKNVKKVNFGNFKLGSISGMKFNDANGNGKKDNGEVGLAEWTINLKGPGASGPTVSTVTNASGNYSFTGLHAGTYTLSEASQTGWNQTTHPGKVTIDSDTNATKKNFGNTQLKLDSDGDYDGDTGNNNNH